ncbi:MAG: hypothetical protein DRH04_00260 [Deltaproteobacteria bacterium]|nr:MAG: hypothetical protein DRH04_00260 [Deltaproteobacteria bacterium]
MTPTAKKTLLVKISRQPLPLFAKAANICRRNAARLPSRGQLHDFHHRIQTGSPEEMKNYLEQRMQRVANRAWSQVTIGDKKLGKYFREKIIDKILPLEKLDHDTVFLGWRVGPFLYDNRVPVPLALDDNDRKTLVRLILTRFIEYLLLARAGAAPPYDERNGRVAI